MSKIIVDHAELTALGRHMSEIAAALDRDARRGGLAGQVGEPILARALQSVENDWSTKRGQIVQYLQGCGEAVTSAADAYREVDETVARAAGR